MKNVKRIASILVIASLTITLLIGCSSTITPKIRKTSATTKYSQTIKYDATAIKTLYLKTLKALVKAGTITQEQSDKVLTAVIKDMPQKADGTAQNLTNTVTEDIVTDDNGTNNKNQANNAHDNHILSALIINKVLTQAQANTLSQKLGETMKSTQSTNTK